MQPKYISLPLSAIVKSEMKLKMEDTEKIEKLRSSIDKYGQLEALQVREVSPVQYECITGSKILRCMSELGYENVLAINYGIISETEAKHIAVATGLYDFEPDRVNLALILKELSKHYPIEILLENIPMTRFELETYIAYPDFSWDNLIEEEKERDKKRKNKLQPEGMTEDEDGFELPNLFLLSESCNPYSNTHQ